MLEISANVINTCIEAKHMVLLNEYVYYCPLVITSDCCINIHM